MEGDGNSDIPCIDCQGTGRLWHPASMSLDDANSAAGYLLGAKEMLERFR